MRLPSLDRDNLDYRSLKKGLADFADSWLSVLTGQMSIALNAMAVAHSSSAGSALGRIVLDNGRFAIGRRVKPVLEMARDAGLLAFDDTEEAFCTFFGLVVRDVQIRALLGDRPLPDRLEIKAGHRACRTTVSHALRRAGKTRPGQVARNETQSLKGKFQCAFIMIVMQT